MPQITFGLHRLCYRCKGEGRLPVRSKTVTGKWRTDHVPCTRCNALGYMVIVEGIEMPDIFAGM